MTTLILQRIITGDSGTFGIIKSDSKIWCVTCELPWKDNQEDVSCIPEGCYAAQLGYSNRFQKTLYMLQGVPDRASIEIHIGNSIHDTHGCILIGTGFDFTGGSILYSQLAFTQFMQSAPKDGFSLIVKGV